jgi:hypothetical protein
MAWAPTARPDVVNAMLPPETVDALSTVLPSLNVTVPVANWGTDAVNVTEVPYAMDELVVLNITAVTFVAFASKSVFPVPSSRNTVVGESEIVEPDAVAVTLGNAV